MNFEKLVDLYFESPNFLRLDSKSQAMYTVYIKRLKVLGSGMPITDRDMQDRVARSPSRSPFKWKGNLTTFWWNAINHFQMENGKKTTDGTRNMLHTYLKVVYRFAVVTPAIPVSEYDLPTNFEGWKKSPKKNLPLQLAEVHKIEKSLEDPTYPEDIKAYMMFTLFMFYAGLRPMEMYDHEVQWFTKKGGKTYYEVWTTKGNNTAAEVTSYRALDKQEQDILAYFKKQGAWPGHEKYTFRTAKGKKFQQSGWMADQINVGMALAGVPARQLYDARRGLVTTLYKSGMPFSKIKERVNHLNEKTTRKYAVLDLMEKADTYQAPWAPQANA